MSAEIIRMLAERQALEPRSSAISQTSDPDLTELFSMIDRAAPYIDKGADQTKWFPSQLLKLTFCIMASGPNPNGRSEGFRFIWKMLDRARRLFLAGRHPNPFIERSPS